MTDRFRVPKQNFFTPEDATTWATILEARYWNDRMEDMFNTGKVVERKVEIDKKNDESDVMNVQGGSQTYRKPENFKQQENFHQIPFSQILLKRQKPNLFGSSIVSLKLLNNTEPKVKNEIISERKRTRLEKPSEEEASFSKRRK